MTFVTINLFIRPASLGLFRWLVWKDLNAKEPQPEQMQHLDEAP